jgi:hypothetical protein
MAKVMKREGKSVKFGHGFNMSSQVNKVKSPAIVVSRL